MNTMCRQSLAPALRRQHLAIAELLRHARIVAGPGRLAYLNPEVARRKIKIKKKAEAGRPGAKFETG